MSIQSEAERIKANVAAPYAAAAGLGAEMPDAQNSNNLSKTVAGAKAVLYAPQELTAEQQTQARNNIGAASADTVSQLSKDVEQLKGNIETDLKIAKKISWLSRYGTNEQSGLTFDPSCPVS